MVRHHRYYSNVPRRMPKNSGQDGLVHFVIHSEVSSKGHRKNWTRLILKIYEIDPLAFPRCKGEMRIIAFIGDPEIIRNIGRRWTSPQARRLMESRASTPAGITKIHPQYTI